MKKLGHTLKLTSLYDYGFGFVIFCLCLFNYIFLILLFVFVVKRRRCINVLFFTFLCFLILIRFVILNDIETKITENINGDAKVIKIEKQNYNDRLTIVYQNQKYHLNAKISEYNIGDILLIKGKAYEYKAVSMENQFDIKSYYLSQGVIGYIKASSITYKENKDSLYSFRQSLILKVEPFSSKEVIKTFLFGECKEPLINSDLMFLLKVSGMHLYFLILLVKYLLFKLNIKLKYQNIIISFVYLILLYLQMFSFTIFRIVLYFVLKSINQKHEMIYHSLEIHFVTFYIMLLLNINLIYHPGLLPSVLIIIVVNLAKNNYKSYNGYLRKLYISTLISIVTFPLFTKINIINLLLMPVYSTIFSLFGFIGSIIVLVFPFLDKMFHIINTNLFLIIDNLQFDNVVINTKTFNTIELCVYYVILFFILRTSKKNLRRLRFSYLLITVVFINVFAKAKTMGVYFLDVGQGDATVILCNDLSIVIDCYRNVGNFLEQRNIDTIDLLILTHPDNDHVNEANDLLNNFNVNKVILNPYDEYDLNVDNIYYPNLNEKIIYNGVLLHFLGPLRDYENKNDNSLIIKLTFLDQTFLFVGDASIKVEHELIDEHQDKLKSDYLKLGHHGSKTSSSLIFLKTVDPRLVIISVGYNNNYGLPDLEVIERLKFLRIAYYRTDINGSISYTKKKKWQSYLS